VVAFDWIELRSDEDCQRELALPDLANARLPVVELPDEQRLFAPSVRELAERLGWVTLEPIIGRPIRSDAIMGSWDDILRLTASIKAGVVAPSAMLRKFGAYKAPEPARLRTRGGRSHRAHPVHPRLA